MAAVMLAVLIPVAMVALWPKRCDEFDPADFCCETVAPSQLTFASPNEVPRFDLVSATRTRAFVTTSLPFALALTAQVAILTHQMALLSPAIGTIAAGWAISLTTLAAAIGRVATGFVVDRCNRRCVAAPNFAAQALGIGVLAATTGRDLLYLGCVLFGVGVGNATSLPGLIVQQEFPKQHFARIVSLVVAINQFSFAFGHTLLAQLQRVEGGYSAALLVCLAMNIAAAIVILMPIATRHNAPARTWLTSR